VSLCASWYTTKMLATRVCRTCKQPLPESVFRIKDKHTGRRMTQCRTCHNAYLLARYHADPETHKRRVLSWRGRNPERAKAIRLRHDTKNAEKIRERQRRYESNRREQRAAYRVANAEHIKQWAAEYRERAADKIKAYNSRYNRENADAIKARVAKCNAAKPHLYNQLHKAAKHRRKVRMTNNGPCESFTDLEIYERDGWRCGLCGATVDRTIVYPNPMSASLDHRMPIARGGGHTRDNVQLAHLGCNSRKRDRAA
jgi:hypothetical protein